jgi:2-oxoglutarate ferredoxin oxidoreductase subunit delta
MTGRTEWAFCPFNQLFKPVRGNNQMAKNKGQTRVRIFSDWCKGCGICVAFCPGKVFEMGKDGKAKVVREEECLNCGFCEMHCPDFAVSVRPKDESNGMAGNGQRNGTISKDIPKKPTRATTRNTEQPEEKPVQDTSTES